MPPPAVIIAARACVPVRGRTRDVFGGAPLPVAARVALGWRLRGGLSDRGVCLGGLWGASAACGAVSGGRGGRWSLDAACDGMVNRAMEWGLSQRPITHIMFPGGGEM